MTFLIEAKIGDRGYLYELQLDLPDGFQEFRVELEYLQCDGKTIFTRHLAEVKYQRPRGTEASFPLDWHRIALPSIQEAGSGDPLNLFREWLAAILIIAPVPSAMTGESRVESRELATDCSNFAEWYRGLTVEHGSAAIERVLGRTWSDFERITNPQAGEARNLELLFREGDSTVRPRFPDLSDGEKCLILHAAVVAWAESQETPVCFWDEPDNHISLDEIQDYSILLRSKIGKTGQLIATSHNRDAINTFGLENTFILRRPSHTAPTRPPDLASNQINSESLAESIARGEVLR